MPDIRNRTRDQEVSDNFWFRCCVEHSDSNEAEEAIDIAELEGQDLRGGSQGGRKEMRELRGDEGGRVTSNGDVSNDSGCEISRKVCNYSRRVGNTGPEVRRL